MQSCMAATGLCRQSIANALKRLESCGILRITRRLIGEAIDAGGLLMLICRQGSNLYAVHEPGRARRPASCARRQDIRLFARAPRSPGLDENALAWWPDFYGIGGNLHFVFRIEALSTKQRQLALRIGLLGCQKDPDHRQCRAIGFGDARCVNTLVSQSFCVTESGARKHKWEQKYFENYIKICRPSGSNF